MWSCVLFSLLLWRMGSSITVNDCPDNLEHDGHLNVFEDKCYYFYLNVKRQFKDAQETCRQNGGKLASVKTLAVNDFIWKHIKNEFDFSGKVWIGLSDQDEEGQYVWRDGSRMVYNNFESYAGPREGWFDLSHTYQDCVAMKSLDGQWTDLRCKNSFLSSGYRGPFVCEFSPKSYTSTQVTKDDCPVTVTRDQYLQVLDDSCYYFYLNSRLNFPTSQTTCKYHGGNLVSIKSQKVQDFIWKTLRYTYELGSEAWIGLRDDKDDGVFVWRDGSVADYKNFASGKEQYYHRDCVSISSFTGHWIDRDCDDGVFSNNHKYFICEFHATPRTTTPRTTTTTTTTTPMTSTLRPTTTMSTTKTNTPTPTTTCTTSPPPTTTSPLTTTTHVQLTTIKTASTATSSSTTTTQVPITATKTQITTTKTQTTTTQAPTTTTKTQTTTTQAPTTATTSKQSTSTKIQTTITNTPTTIISPHPPITITTAATTSASTTPSTTTTSTLTPTTVNPTTQTTTQLQETTSKPSITSTLRATFPKETTVTATCPTVVCNLDCGMSGFDKNPDDGCLLCRCQEE